MFFTLEYFKEVFQKIADEYTGEYEVEEYTVGGMDFSSEHVSYHKLVIPINEFDLILANLMYVPLEQM